MTRVPPLDPSLQKKLAQVIFDHTSAALIFTDHQGTIRAWNRTAESLLGIPATEAIGKPYSKLVSPGLVSPAPTSQSTPERCPSLPAPSQSSSPLPLQVRDRTIWVDRSVTPFDMNGEPWSFIELRDANARIQREMELERAATTDELSQLANRRGFQAALESHLDKRLALAILDIDHLKKINDQDGHAMGDEAIVFVANRLQEVFSDAICVARLGGDEFGIILDSDTRPTLADEFTALVTYFETNHFSQQARRLTVSIGIAISPAPPSSARWLLTTADQALYESKTSGRNRVTIRS